mgnify:CR=1 FL=1
MAISIKDAANRVLYYLEKFQIPIENTEKAALVSTGEAKIIGFRCKTVNLLSPHKCRILVNKKWFSHSQIDYSRPFMQSRSQPLGVDYQLIPMSKKLFAIHFMDLRHYALLLEKDREHWFNQSYWGMQILEERDTFVWEGGNSISFPLLNVTKSSVFVESQRTILQSIKLY